MGHSASTEAIIAIAAQLKDQVTGLYQAYVRLPQVIQEEHEAIKSGNIGIIEAAGETKIKLSESIETCFNSMRQSSEELKAWRRRLVDGATRPVVTLRDCVSVLEELGEHLSGETFGVQVLRHQAQGLKQLVADFDGQFKRVQPLVEMNKHVTERMLINQQESYRFWVSIIEETEAAYNSQGVQKVQGRHSGFKVTA